MPTQEGHSPKLDKKVALVTGGGSGIGRASALAFSDAGASVIVADRSVSAGEETAQIIRDKGGLAEAITVDVTIGREVADLVLKATHIYGRLDIAHNNAGVEQGHCDLADIPEEEFDHVLNVNTKGVWLSMKYEIPAMLANGGGCIVNTSSVAGVAGVKQVGAYVASKHAVVGLTKAAALDYAPNGIRVNAVCPGVIRTALFDRRTAADPDAENRFVSAHPMGRLGTPEEVAQAVIWLCSPASAFTTGTILTVDGGWLI